MSTSAVGDLHAQSHALCFFNLVTYFYDAYSSIFVLCYLLADKILLFKALYNTLYFVFICSVSLLGHSFILFPGVFLRWLSPFLSLPMAQSTQWKRWQR